MLQKLCVCHSTLLQHSCHHWLLGNGQHSKPSSLHFHIYLSRLMMQTIINKQDICYINRVANAFQEILRFSLVFMCTFSAFNLERDTDCLETKIKVGLKGYNMTSLTHDKSQCESQGGTLGFLFELFPSRQKEVREQFVYIRTQNSLVRRKSLKLFWALMLYQNSKESQMQKNCCKQ